MQISYTPVQVSFNEIETSKTMESNPSTECNCKTCQGKFTPAYPKQVFCPACTAAHKAKTGTAPTKPVAPTTTPKPATSDPKTNKPFHQKLPCSTPHCVGKQKCAFLTQEGYAVGFCYVCLCSKLALKPTVSKK